MWRSTFFQAGRRYEAWSWYECILPDDYCGWSTPLAVSGGKITLNTILSKLLICLVYKSQQNKSFAHLHPTAE